MQAYIDILQYIHLLLGRGTYFWGSCVARYWKPAQIIFEGTLFVPLNTIEIIQAESGIPQVVIIIYSQNNLWILSVLSAIKSLSCVNMRIHSEENNCHWHISTRHFPSRTDFFPPNDIQPRQWVHLIKKVANFAKKLSIWFKIVPEVLLLTLWFIWIGSNCHYGSKMLSGGGASSQTGG